MKLTLKLTLLACILILAKSSVVSQELQEAPLSSEFVEYIKNKGKTKMGYIPPPESYVFSKSNKLKKSTKSYPKEFSLVKKGLVTSVKNQGSAGHCWTFSAMGAIESRNLVLGIGTTDLSEMNLATCHGFQWTEGGNQSMAMAYLTGLKGPLRENQDFYDPKKTGCTVNNIKPQFYVTESRFLPKNSNVIKEYLMNYGAIAVSYYTDQSNTYLRKPDNTYYYNGKKKANHAVLLVGWDDNKPTAGGTGAWIIKNSWGDTWGDNGYFYMSYNDVHAMANAVVYPSRKETKDIDTLLSIDKLGKTSSLGFRKNEAYALIKYNVNEEFNFTKIGTYINESNSFIDIEVFKIKNNNLLSDTIAKVYNLYADYPGYHTFGIPFKTSGEFYVKIKYHTPNYLYPIPIEKTIDGYAIPAIKSNMCWVSPDSKEWESIGSNSNKKCDLCIRVYGNKIRTKASFNANYTSICPKEKILFSDNSKGTINSYKWIFGKDAIADNTTGKGPHEVSYTSPGFKTIKLIVTDNNNKVDTATIYNYIKVKDNIDISILANDTIYLLEDEIKTLIADGAETYIWEPQSIIKTNHNNKIDVAIKQNTKLYVTGNIGRCQGRDSVMIILKVRPENDDVCNAIKLEIGKVYDPFTNIDASVEENEPFPPTTDCVSPLKWCDEGGLQNSVWFTFVAGSKDLNIATRGLDNQIAIYDAENCEDLLSGNKNQYKLIAANDDFTSKDSEAKILGFSSFTDGKKYWLQVDGSGGGASGKFSVYLSEGKYNSTSTINNINTKIYPNPTSGKFKIDLSEIKKIDQNTKIEIYSINGILISKIEVKLGKKIYNVELKNKGIYIVHITTSDNKHSMRLVVK